MTPHAPPRAVLEAGLVLAWSSGFIGARLAADASPVFLVLFWRFAIVSLLLLPFAIGAVLRGLPLGSLVLQSALGALAMFGYLALGVKAIGLGVPAGTAALVSALQPLATAALAGPLRHECVSRKQVLGLVLGLVGVSLAVGGSLGSASVVAYGLSLLSTVSLVIATLLAKALPDSTPLLPALGIQTAVSAGLFAPLAMLDEGIVPVVDTGFIGAVAWFVAFSTVAAYGLYWICLRRSTATRVGSLIYLTPPVTMIWAWIMFAEPIPLPAVVGFGICLVGVVLAGAPRVEAAAATAHSP